MAAAFVGSLPTAGALLRGGCPRHAAPRGWVRGGRPPPTRCSLVAPGGGLGRGSLWRRRPTGAAAVGVGAVGVPASGGGVWAFDKVPASNPYEDDDDDDEEGEGGGGGDAGGGRGGGGGGGGGGGSGGGGGGDGNRGPPGPRGMLAWAAHLWTYNLARRPILCKALSTAVIGLLGDLAAQVVGHRQALARVPPGCPYRPPFTLDARRTAAVAGLGFAFTGPALHAWYEVLGRVFPGGSWGAIAASVAADQGLFAPVVNGVYLLATGLMEGGAAAEVVTKARRGWVEVWRKSVALWVPAQVVNFGLVPAVWRVPYVNGVALVWTVLLSCVAHA